MSLRPATARRAPFWNVCEGFCLMQAQEEEFQSQIDLLLHPLSCYSSDERYPSSF